LDRLELERSLAELLGFRVTEREHDAVVELYQEPLPAADPAKVRAVRPATREEVTLYLKLMGFVARMGEATTVAERQAERIDEYRSRYYEAQQKVAELAAEGNGLRESNNNMMAALSKSDKAIATMGMALQKADLTIKDLLRANQECKAEIERLNGECDNLTKQRDEAAQESASAQHRVIELEEPATPVWIKAKPKRGKGSN
jgi:DNA repair exonuclease SbcCD ATPase subunit